MLADVCVWGGGRLISGVGKYLCLRVCERKTTWSTNTKFGTLLYRMHWPLDQKVKGQRSKSQGHQVCCWRGCALTAYRFLVCNSFVLEIWWRKKWCNWCLHQLLHLVQLCCILSHQFLTRGLETKLYCIVKLFVSYCIVCHFYVFFCFWYHVFWWLKIINQKSRVNLRDKNDTGWSDENHWTWVWLWLVGMCLIVILCCDVGGGGGGGV